MLNTILEYRKGILFIRLDGVLTKNSVYDSYKELSIVINKDNLDNYVINLKDLKEIDYKGINLLFYLYEISKKNKGNIYICGVNENIRKKLTQKRVFKYIKEIKNELESFKLIKIGE